MTTLEWMKKNINTKGTKTFQSVMVSDGVLYSYGYHYPLATIINGKGYINDRGYSVTTSKHISWAWSALGYSNCYHAPLPKTSRYYEPNPSFTRESIILSASKEYDRLQAEMDAKKRKDTRVYEWLQVQRDRMTATIDSFK